MGTFSTVGSGFLRVIPVLVVLMLHMSLSIDMDSSRESKCFEIKNTVPVDVKWVTSVKKWYLPWMSRAELYYSAIEHLETDPKTIPESDLYYKFCMTGGELASPDGFYFTGFSGKKVSFRRVYKDNGKHRMEFLPLDKDDIVSTCYVPLTDNKTYYFRACCYMDGQMMWGLDSVSKTLPPETVKYVLDEAEKMGFKREHFVELRYDYC